MGQDFSREWAVQGSRGKAPGQEGKAVRLGGCFDMKIWGQADALLELQYQGVSYVSAGAYLQPPSPGLRTPSLPILLRSLASSSLWSNLSFPHSGLTYPFLTLV